MVAFLPGPFFLTCSPAEGPDPCELAQNPRYRKGPDVCFDNNKNVRRNRTLISWRGAELSFLLCVCVSSAACDCCILSIYNLLCIITYLLLLYYYLITAQSWAKNIYGEKTC